MATTKFYLTQNLSVPVRLGDKRVAFDDAGFFGPTNSTWGIYATEDAKEQEGLAALVDLGLIEETSEEDYAKLATKKKLKPSAVSLIELQPSHGRLPGQGSEPNLRPAVVVQEESRPPVQAEPLSEILATAKPVKAKGK